MSPGNAIKRLASFTDDVFVIVRRREAHESTSQYWYQYRLGDLRALVQRPNSCWAAKLDTPLVTVLNLHEYTANRTVQVSEGSAEEAPRDSAILLDGDTVVAALQFGEEAHARGSGRCSGSELKSLQNVSFPVNDTVQK
jgi:hypothetical protein